MAVYLSSAGTGPMEGSLENSSQDLKENPTVYVAQKVFLEFSVNYWEPSVQWENAEESKPTPAALMNPPN